MNKRIPALLGAAGAVLAVICPLVHALAWDSSPKAVPAPAAVEIEAQLPAPAPVHILLGDAVPVDVNLQTEIYGVCGCDPELFCAVMAIAAWETRGSFDSGAVGDSGASYGIMQINTLYQYDRMEALGVTDLTDPVQCATVAVDYLLWLRDNLDGAGYDSHQLYMAYNMGLTGCLDALESGTTSTEYSRAAVEYYRIYMEAIQ